MEEAENIAKYLLSLDELHEVFTNEVITLKGINCYAGNVRLNKYLHIMQMVYYSINDTLLFSDNMYAYKNGVVVITVMNRYHYLWRHKYTYEINSYRNKIFIRAMYEILKNISLDELIKISEKDPEWKIKHIAERRIEQLMVINKDRECYQNICARFINKLSLKEKEFLNIS